MTFIHLPNYLVYVATGIALFQTYKSYQHYVVEFRCLRAQHLLCSQRAITNLFFYKSKT